MASLADIELDDLLDAADEHEHPASARAPATSATMNATSSDFFSNAVFPMRPTFPFR